MQGGHQDNTPEDQDICHQKHPANQENVINNSHPIFAYMHKSIQRFTEVAKPYYTSSRKLNLHPIGALSKHDGMLLQLFNEK